MELSLSGRLHEIIRQNSIRTIYEALVELVTNSIDAYSRMGKSRKDVWIYIQRNPEKHFLSVVDQARGMSKDEMLNNLLVVGGYTATDDSRGFIGRGCKDCSFLGDITFTSVKDDLINQLIIYQNRTADILIDNLPVTQEDRDKYKIDVNGFHVKLALPAGTIPKVDVFYDNLKNNIYLRNIYQDATVVVKEESTGFDKKVVFTYPERKLVVACDYDVPGYNAKARLEIYKSKTAMPFPRSSDQRQFAINVQSSKTIFENSALYYSGGSKVQDYIFNPNIQYISGVLICDKIEELAREAVGGNITSSNPYLIIDPNRRNGLMKEHPFTAALYQYAYYMLSIIIERVQDTREEDLLGNGNSADLMKSLSDFVTSMLPGSSTMYAFRTHEDQDKLNLLTQTMKNVELDSEFLGLTWEQLQELSRNKSIQLTQDTVTSSGFNISFTKDPTLNTPYTILYLPSGISMKINANDPSIKPFINITEESVEMTNIGKGMTAVGSMVTDATTDLVVRRNIMQNNTSVLDISGFNEYQYTYNSSRYNLAPSIYSRVLASIDAGRELS